MVKKKKVKAVAKKGVVRAKRVKVSKAEKATTGKKAVKKTAIKARPSVESTLEKIGEVTHYFPHVNAAAVAILKDSLKVGDKIYIKGHTSDFKERVDSMQLDHVPVQEGKKGQEIGLLVKSRVRIGDSVYKI